MGSEDELSGWDERVGYVRERERVGGLRGWKRGWVDGMDTEDTLIW